MELCWSNPIRSAVFLCAGLAPPVFFSCCAIRHCPPEELEKPPRESFSRIPDFRPEGAPDDAVYPIWHTKSPSKRPVLLLHAMNGLSPRTLELGLEMEQWGYRVYLPSLYGRSIREKDDGYGFDDPIAALKYLKESDRWEVRSTAGPGPILDDVRRMTDHVSELEDGKDLIVIGNCMTGAFPFALFDKSCVTTAVLAQPATPLKENLETLFGLPQARSKGLSLALPKERVIAALNSMEKAPRKRIIGFHYVNDPIAPIGKFRTLRDLLAPRGLEKRFETVVMAPMWRLNAAKHEWGVAERTRKWRGILRPHSTIITGANCEDRTWFRDQLRRTLEAAN